MQHFRRMPSLQKFAAVHLSVYNHFYQKCRLCRRGALKLNRTAFLTNWRQFGAT